MKRLHRATLLHWPLAMLCATLLSLAWAADAWAANPQPQLTVTKPPASMPPGGTVDLDFQATNAGADATNGSLTISVQGTDNVKIVDRSLVPNNDSSYAKIIPVGTPMFNRQTGTNTNSQLLTVELFAQPWPANTTHHMHLQFVASSGLTLFARTTLRSASGGLFTDPSTGSTDQQGFTATQINIPLAQAAAPTPTTRPAPTAVPVQATAPPVQPTRVLVTPTTGPVATRPPQPTSVPPPTTGRGVDSSVWLIAVPVLLVAGGGVYVMGRRSAPRPPTRRPVVDPDSKEVEIEVEPVDFDDKGQIVRPKR
jgi:hypothetical protein